MRWFHKPGAVALSFAAVIGVAIAEDEVQRRSATVPLRGTITSESATEITIQRKDTGKSEAVSVQEVSKVKYEGGKAAAEFTQAESLERGGEYQKAMDAYAKIAQEYSGREYLARAAQFGRISALVRQAQKDSSKADDAIAALEEFRKKHPDSRFHYPLHESLGQLYLAKGSWDQASKAFAELGKAPWPDLQWKATNYAGRTLILANRIPEAIAQFDSVLRAANDSADGALRRAEALLGKAECLIKQKQHMEAEKMLREVVANVSHDESAIRARAHNLLGDVLRETNRAGEAIFDYLYVDIYYARERDEHAKALCYVALLFEQRGQNDRAEETRSRLKKDYPSSPWVKVAQRGTE
jgi:tetratricopeptide (TPR) repeat protein